MGTCMSESTGVDYSYPEPKTAEAKHIVDELVMMGFDRSDCLMALFALPTGSGLNNVIETITKMKEQRNMDNKSMMVTSSPHTRMDIDEAVQYLVKKGFDFKKSLRAFIVAKYDIKDAKNILTKYHPPNHPISLNDNSEEMKHSQTVLSCDNCKQCVSECQSASIVMEFLNDLNQPAIKDLITDGFTIEEAVIAVKESIRDGTAQDYYTTLLNCFHHLLFYHGSDDQFKYIHDQTANGKQIIYHRIGVHKQCKLPMSFIEYTQSKIDQLTKYCGSTHVVPSYIYHKMNYKKFAKPIRCEKELKLSHKPVYWRRTNRGIEQRKTSSEVRI